MKKRNKGFILLETLVVSTFIITLLIYLYVQFSNLKKSYDISFRYNTIYGLYASKEMDKFINDNYGYGELIEKIESNDNKYIEIVNKSECEYLYFSDNINYCKKLVSNLNINTILLASSNLDKLKSKLSTNNVYSNDFYLYIKNINSKKNDNSYIMIVEYNDKTFANINIEKSVGEENE